jgi:murein DD-endopeptidase MepM/ murein hydrolase activator NlpD
VADPALGAVAVAADSTTGAAGGAAPGGGSFAAALADAGIALPTGIALPAGTAGGPVSSAWTIPWIASPGAEAEAEPSDSTAPAAQVGVPVAGATKAGVLAASAMPGSAAAGATDRARTAAEKALVVVSPLSGRLTQPFGPTTSRYSAPMTVDGVHYDHFHDGIDLAAPIGRPVRAMAAGEVEFAGRYPDGAQVVRIRHADGSVALYAHLRRGLDVRAGDKVAAVDRIGVVGMTGHTTGPHLHLELTVDGTAVDPRPVIDGGRLPGATGGGLDTSVLPVGDAGRATAEVLGRFDRVAGRIPHAALIREAAVNAGIDPLLLASLVKHESGFRADAVSRCGAMGLTQLMPATAKAAHLTDPFDPAQNLRAGAKYLAFNLRMYGRVDLSLAAYQAGKGAVARAGGIPASPTTHRYIDRILHTWAGYLEAAA